MDTALVIGGTRFIGRHTVEELLDHGYEVTIFNRGTHENPFATVEGVTHVEGDRGDETALEATAVSVDPDLVIDCVAYHPEGVRTATEVFSDSRYVYVSSGAAYARREVPQREGETPLEPCSPEQADDDSMGSYGPRKAEGDRVVVEAAGRGIEAMAVRPCIVYGPHDYTERLDYWISRVRNHDRVVVPGDGQHLQHLAYVADVASALRVVGEDGVAGEAYNVGDRRLLTLAELIETIADAAGTDVEVVPAGERELAAGGLSPTDFPLYREYPHVLSTARLASLDWESTPVGEAMSRTVADHEKSGRDGSEHDPGREAEERVLGVLDTL
ncbi:NAD-dependent epimerase/dehydratase family protein [Halalkalicoccus sp. NIPERK01]|uniref:NAD-dependent epimerase/dehydratase family protein n=1 Tax=Halalkalicoccus sp. NIPERK01 TaxID=3053469 RepID=UPI00256F58E3|nr:NAD-dependent epimerase/dehydratase family protein [Halalkalicoccus sp. NIPERK01]MDL5361844.1 NAD-dependent epimerase/dehydratase family protein [Halalkalicoccus sp. NIPERK01]